MKTRSMLAVATLVLAVSATVSYAALSPGGDTVQARTPVARAAPSYPAPPASLTDAVPLRLDGARPGEARVVEGAFTDRVRFERLVVRAGVLTGTMTVTSDVSEIIVAELVAGFYDASGRLVGTATQRLAEEHAADEEIVIDRKEGEPQALLLTGPKGAVSAALLLPTLVNE